MRTYSSTINNTKQTPLTIAATRILTKQANTPAATHLLVEEVLLLDIGWHALGSGLAIRYRLEYFTC